MAKSGNTWCKKLMHRQKVYGMKHALGTSARFKDEGWKNIEAGAQRRRVVATLVSVEPLRGSVLIRKGVVIGRA